jgi:hypothetical protein
VGVLLFSFLALEPTAPSANPMLRVPGDPDVFEPL